MPPSLETFKLEVWPRIWPERYRQGISAKTAYDANHVPILFEHKFFRCTSQSYVSRFTSISKFRSGVLLRKGWLSDMPDKKFGGFYAEEIQAVANYLPFVGLANTQQIVTRLERKADIDRWLTMSEAVEEMNALGKRIAHIRDIPKTLSLWVSNDVLKSHPTAGIFLTNARWLSATLRYMEIIESNEEIE